MNDNIRVLHFYKTSIPDSIGGVEKVIDQIASGCQKYGIQSKVLSLSENPTESSVEFNGYDIYRAKCDFSVASTDFSFSVFSKFAELAKEADVIHYHFPWPFMDLVHFMCRVKKPTVVTYHSDIVRQKKLLMLYKPLMYKFLGSVDRIVSTSPNYFATSEVLKKFNYKVNIIPIGLDKGFYPNPSKELLDYWQKRVGKGFFLFVGAFRYYKGLHILLDASREKDFPIVMIGGGLADLELKERAKELNLKNIHFLGQLPDEDKVALIKLSLGIVFPSHLRSEAFGVSLLEGAMFGKPMISCEIGTGTTFVNVDKETGLVVPPSYPDALREAMQYLLDNPAEASKMGRRAEERYNKFFTGDQQAASYAKLYRDLIQE